MFFGFVIDAFSRRVVGWSLAGHMRTDLVLDVLRMALGTREHGADLQTRARQFRTLPQDGETRTNLIPWGRLPLTGACGRRGPE